MVATVGVKGQSKIGNITVSDSVAKAYLLDCYNHPEKLTEKSVYDYWSCNNCSIPGSEWDKIKDKVESYNNQLRKDAIGHWVDTVKYQAGVDTVYEGYVFGNGKSTHYGKATIQPHPAGVRLDYKGYLVPRKPSEIDFIRWLAKNPELLRQTYSITK